MAIDETFEKYDVLEMISEGGMGRVYKVRHRLKKEIRALKELRPGLARNPTHMRRFRREAKLARELRHPNVVTTYGYELKEDDYNYIEMEYLDGVTVKSLAELTAELELDLALEIARQGLDGLQAVHASKLVHRDVAPDNFMLVDDGGSPRIKLIDLGIAKKPQSDLTQTGEFLGKTRYASPEVFKGKKVTHRSDQYSFGVMLYELLTGQPPIPGEVFEELALAHLREEPVPFSESDPEGGVPEDVRKVVLRMLAKEPGDRFGSVEEVAGALADARREHPLKDRDVEALIAEIQSRQPSLSHRTPGPSTRQRIAHNVRVTLAPEDARVTVIFRKREIGERLADGSSRALKQLGGAGRWVAAALKRAGKSVAAALQKLYRSWQGQKSPKKEIIAVLGLLAILAWVLFSYLAPRPPPPPPAVPEIRSEIRLARGYVDAGDYAKAEAILARIEDRRPALSVKEWEILAQVEQRVLDHRQRSGR